MNMPSWLRSAFNMRGTEKDPIFFLEWEPFTPAPLDYRQFQWLTWGRLALVLLLFIAIFLFSNYLGPVVQLPDALFKVAYLSLAALAVTYSYIQWYRTGKWLRQLSLMQITLDIVFAAAVVYVTGMALSPFLFLFPVIVLAACLLQGRQGGQFSAVFFTLIYAFIVWLDKSFSLHDSSNLIVFFVNIVVVNLTALLAGALSERLKRAEHHLSRAVVDLKRVQEMQRYLADSLESGLVMLDMEGRILALNRRAETILSIRSSDYIGSTIYDLWPGIGLDFRNFLSEFQEGDEKRREIFYDGPVSRIILGLSVFNMKDGRGGLLGYGIIFQDLTEIRYHEERLRRVERLASLGEMAAGMAHEIRNPLASISGVVEFLQEGGMVNTEGEKLLGILQREIQRLTELTQSFLLYARPERGGEQPVNVLDIVNETIGLLSSQKLSKLQVRVEVPRDVYVQVNPAQFRQVLLNLILNAVQAMMPKMEMGEKGELFVGVEPGMSAGISAGGSGGKDGGASTKSAVKKIILVVRDNGVGIPEEVMGRIFDPFFTTRADGTGLGLSIVQRLVDAWGGEVECRSNVNDGSEFIIRLPALDSSKI